MLSTATLPDRNRRWSLLPVLPGLYLLLTGCNQSTPALTELPAPLIEAVPVQAAEEPPLLPGPSPEHAARDWQRELQELKFICYFPSQADPLQNREAPLEVIRQDLERIRQAGFTGIVTYSASGQQGLPLVKLAENAGIKILMGLWDPKSREELESAKACGQSQQVVGFVVGNEGYRKRYQLEDLLKAIHELEFATGKPASTTEEIDDYTTYAELLGVGSFLAVNAHPWYHSRAPVSGPVGIDVGSPVRWTVQAYEDLTARTHKLVLFKEVGLPSAGDPQHRLSETAQALYYEALAKTSVKFAWFEYGDLAWKQDTPVEPHWGLLVHADGTLKEFGKKLLAGTATQPLAVPAAVLPQQAGAGQEGGRTPMLRPDGSFALDQAYSPSGLTGDTGDVKMTFAEGGAMRFTYLPQGKGPQQWEYRFVDGKLNPLPARQAGVVWLSPAADFGSGPQCGYDLRKLRPNVIRWEARTLAGSLNVGFYLGGVQWRWSQKSPPQQERVPFPDSLPYTHLGVKRLKPEWQTFEIVLPNPPEDFRRLVGGFAWNITWADNGIQSAETAKPLVFEVRNIRCLHQPDAAVPADGLLPVYLDAGSARSSFFPTGVMGDVGDVSLNPVCTVNPHTGDTCLQVTYTAKGSPPHHCDHAGPCQWAGTYFQYPPNNFGRNPGWAGLGRNLSAFKQVSFWVRADAECFISFMVAGVDALYGDSQTFPQKITVRVTPEWTRQTISLEGDHTHIISGFGWTSSRELTPQGTTFYLDDIVFEK